MKLLDVSGIRWTCLLSNCECWAAVWALCVIKLFSSLVVSGEPCAAFSSCSCWELRIEDHPSMLLACQRSMCDASMQVLAWGDR
ncbi:hypothetical protein HDK90DRAFT_475831 [Phyllosticta capitalensis]|uniref:Secreted protein n=1 Tax=Phyllosticta capitalensis TaxID=121624 RepID=A0ABR1YYL5_9PEZI